MATNTVQTADRVNSVTRRSFLGGTAGIITAASGVTIINSQITSKPLDRSRRQMARALHDAVGQYSDECGPTHVQAWSGDRSLMLEVENLRTCSVDDIQDLLKPLFENGQGGA